MTTANETRENHILDLMNAVIDELRALKSPDRTPLDRHIAVCATEAEKLLAYYRQWVLEYEDEENG